MLLSIQMFSAIGDFSYPKELFRQVRTNLMTNFEIAAGRPE